MTKNFNLFCLPHAGGSKYAYQPFVEAAPSFMNVRLLEYPGRGDKLRQTPLTDAVALAKLLLSEIRDELDVPYVVYGHSMGTLIGLLMLRKIKEAGYKMPKFAFFTGSEGPYSRIHKKIRHQLPKDELIEELRSLGGVSEEVLNEPDVMDLFLPIIRADFQAIETFKYQPMPPMDIPINVAIGTQEEVTYEQAKSWQYETTYPLEVMQLRGHHFFIFDHVQRIINLIAEKAEDYLNYSNHLNQQI